MLVIRCFMINGEYVTRMMDVKTFKKYARRTRTAYRYKYDVTRTINDFIYGMDRETFLKYSVDYTR